MAQHVTAPGNLRRNVHPRIQSGSTTEAVGVWYASPHEKVSKRRHGLNRCQYRGDDGMKRWIGLGVFVDNLINLGRAIAAQPAT